MRKLFLISMAICLFSTFSFCLAAEVIDVEKTTLDSIDLKKPLKNRLYSKNTLERLSAMSELIKSKDTSKINEFLPFLIKQLDDETIIRGPEVLDASMGFIAASVIANLGEEGINILTEVLQNNKSEIARYNAIMVLHYSGKHYSSKGVPTSTFISALKDSSAHVRYVAANEFCLRKDPSAVGPLVALLNDPSEDVRDSAVYALGYITGEKFGHDYKKWQEWWSSKNNK